MNTVTVPKTMFSHYCVNITSCVECLEKTCYYQQQTGCSDLVDLSKRFIAHSDLCPPEESNEILLVGVAVGVGVCVFALVLLGFFLYRRLTNRKRTLAIRGSTTSTGWQLEDPNAGAQSRSIETEL